MLKSSNGFEVIAEANSPNTLLEILEKGTLPDIVVFDIVMPGMSGLEVAVQIRKNYPDVKILFLSSENGEKVLAEAIKIGVDGFLSKLDLGGDLPKAVRSIHEGRKYYGKEISDLMCAALVSERILDGKNKARFEVMLSEREIEITALRAKGLRARQIANSYLQANVPWNGIGPKYLKSWKFLTTSTWLGTP